MKYSRLLLLAFLCSLASRPADAGSATWNLHPATSDWNTTANWTPTTVPNGSADVATFAASALTHLTLSAQVTVESIVFAPGASAFTIDAPAVLFVDGAGIINQSGVMQTFSGPIRNGIHGGVFFFGNATAGDLTTYTLTGGNVFFSGDSSAGTSTILNGSEGTQQGSVTFNDHATAAQSNVVAQPFGNPITFSDTTSAGQATITLQGSPASGSFGGNLFFVLHSSAGQSTTQVEGGSASGAFGGNVTFRDDATAAEAKMTFGGAAVPGAFGGSALLIERATAGNATLTLNGGSATGAAGAVITFDERSGAGAASLIVNGGSNGGQGGVLQFRGRSSGGTARLVLSGNGQLDLSNRSPIAPPTFTIGSLEGDGLVTLGANNFGPGTNNLDTVFSGVVEGAGALEKVGSGTLTLNGANTYSGGTTVSGGTLIASNSTGSATGAGPVQVNAGTLGGGGVIAGSVTVGAGSGSRSFLAPAAGSKKQTVLTVQSALTLQSDATYTCTFKARGKQVRADRVSAHGVTIGGASFALSGRVPSHLTQGLTFTLLSNTAADPIVGTFANLADGAILTVNGNRFQASYEGGDGNDLTLTVVP